MASTQATTTDSMRGVWWAIIAAALLVGWFFILQQNHFHPTAPTVMLCLGYLAVVATVANLWRVGAAAVAPEDATKDAWERPIGERVELEKEKKTLLKAIKEAEFDHAMGKLSKADADQLIGMYRTRAIAVIKEIDRIDAAHSPQNTRAEIEREIAARLAVLGAEKKGKGKAKGKRKAEPELAKPVDDSKPVAEAKTDAIEAKDDKKVWPTPEEAIAAAQESEDGEDDSDSQEASS